jgi:hypothetical protein
VRNASRSRVDSWGPCWVAAGGQVPRLAAGYGV